MCVEMLHPHLDHRVATVVSSIGGSNAACKTDWWPVREAIDRGCEIVFLPDRDKPGEKNIQSVAQLLRLEKINVIRLGSDGEDGYDFADWLEENNPADLPEPAFTHPATTARQI